MFERFLKKHFPDAKFSLFWQNKKKKSLVLLTFWVVFIGIVFIIVNRYDTNVEFKKLLLDDLKENLVLENYEFKLDLEQQDLFYVGKVVGSEAKYLKIENDVETNYYINNGEIYLSGDNNYLFLEKLKEPNIYDLDYLLDNIEVVSQTENEINFKKDDIYGTISVIDESNIEVKYNINEIEYKLSISNINKIEKLDIE